MKTIKQLAEILALDEAYLRTLISVFGIKIRGKGEKAARGKAPYLYAEADVRKAVQIVNEAREGFQRA